MPFSILAAISVSWFAQWEGRDFVISYNVRSIRLSRCSVEDQSLYWRRNCKISVRNISDWELLKAFRSAPNRAPPKRCPLISWFCRNFASWASSICSISRKAFSSSASPAVIPDETCSPCP